MTKNVDKRWCLYGVLLPSSFSSSSSGVKGGLGGRGGGGTWGGVRGWGEDEGDVEVISAPSE